MKRVLVLAAFLALGGAMASGAAAQRLPQPPPPGVSKWIDRVRGSGVLRVGVMNNQPWLTQNILGGGEPWSGPAWLLSKVLAKQLGVRLEMIPVSAQTKVTALAANQIDLSITALGVSPDRLKVMDFIVYSRNSVCMVARKNNPRLAGINNVEQLNRKNLDIVYLIGSPDEAYLRERFPQAKVRGVAGQGGAPQVDEVISGHADATPYNRVATLRLIRRVPGIMAFPKDNNCQNSVEQSSKVGIGIAKNNGKVISWANTIVSMMQKDLDDEEARVIARMK